MAEVRTCGKCHHYSRQLLRCKMGRVNPRTKKASREVLKFYGRICAFNKWADELVKEALDKQQMGVN